MHNWFRLIHRNQTPVKLKSTLLCEVLKGVLIV